MKINFHFLRAKFPKAMLTGPDEDGPESLAYGTEQRFQKLFFGYKKSF